jgi:hypothetical protein
MVFNETLDVFLLRFDTLLSFLTSVPNFARYMIVEVMLILFCILANYHRADISAESGFYTTYPMYLSTTFDLIRLL